ncbi:hypothetical protein F442_16199, partial [Phytophthora nicotianae P10297]
MRRKVLESPPVSQLATKLRHAGHHPKLDQFLVSQVSWYKEKGVTVKDEGIRLEVERFSVILKIESPSEWSNGCFIGRDMYLT